EAPRQGREAADGRRPDLDQGHGPGRGARATGGPAGVRRAGGAGPAPPAARFSRRELAQTAIRLVDAEGLDALSMRRLAAELGAGTMTLYHYVRTKDELLTLIFDEVMKEVVVHEELPTDWREAITLIAH